MRLASIAPPPLLSVSNLSKTFASTDWLGRERYQVKAVDDVSFDIRPGETLGLVGESGSGKSTTGRLILRLETPSAGRVLFKGKDLAMAGHAEMKAVRRNMQVVFQNPYGSLNPRMTAGDLVAEPFRIHGMPAAEYRDRVAELFRLVGLDPVYRSRYPHAFSGGQRQRLCIARALALRPEFIVADEPITALDLSIQAQIVNLFQELQEQFHLAYLFITHDLGMVRFLSHRVAVMLKGRIVEIGSVDQVFRDPRHPYTQALLSAMPVPNPALERRRKRLRFDVDSYRPNEARLTPVEDGHLVELST
ncbi:MAG: ABC transporter ATP-binding protein [Burkholderiaceae bacterium]